MKTLRRFMVLTGLSLICGLLHYPVFVRFSIADSNSVVARAQLTERQYEQLQRLQRLVDTAPTDASVLLALGQGLLATPSGSVTQQALIRAHAARLLAEWYQQQGQIEQGLLALEIALRQADELDPATRQALYWFALQLYLEQENFTQALHCLMAWWQDEVEPTAQMYYLRAALLAQLERWVEAQADILLALDQETPSSWLALGVLILQHNQHWSRAVHLQRQRVRQQPDQALFWQQLIQLEYLAGQEEQALITLELAQRQGYLSSAQQEAWARQLLAHQQPLRAAQVLEDLLATSAQQSLTHLRLSAQAWMQTGQHEKTTIALQRLVAYANEPTDRQMLGDWLFSQGRWQEALEVWQPLLDQLEPSAAARLTLLMAQAWIELGHYVAAQLKLEGLLTTTEAEAARQGLNYVRYLQSN